MELMVIGSETEIKNASTMEFGIDGERKKNRIQVSNTKKPLIFYLKLAEKYIKQDSDVELCALGMAIPTVVIISEILKRDGWAIQKNIMTSTIGAKENNKGRVLQKAKLEILLGKAGKMDQNTVSETLEKDVDNRA